MHATLRAGILYVISVTAPAAAQRPSTPVLAAEDSGDATLHDAAIVYPPGRATSVLVVLTRKIPSEATARTLIADISRLVWTHVTSPATLGAR